MLITNLSGLWGMSLQRWMKTQQKHNKKLVKLLLKNSTTLPSAVPGVSTRRKVLPLLATSMLTGRQSATASQPAGQWLKFNHPLTVLESGRSGGGMDYWLYLPQRADMARLPLVVMLHGCAQTAPQFAQSTGMNRLADKEGFAVLYPQQIARNHAGRCWRWYNPEVREGEAETAAIASIINQVAERYALDRSRIYIAGISAGAAMANIVALTHPQLIAAVGMHSGVAFGAAQTPMEGYALMQQGAEQDMHQAVRAAASKMGQLPLMPAVLIHGREDSIVHPVNLAHLAEQFRELHHLAGYARENMTLKITEKQATRRSGRSYKNCEYYFGRKRLLQVCEISELGHAWSGGDASVNFSDGCGPNASRMMWEFFRRHHRAAEALTSHPAPDVSEVERIQAGLV